MLILGEKKKNERTEEKCNVQIWENEKKQRTGYFIYEA